jgi:signal transduction histidine kinase/ActR/RegA family two-component response regulator
MGVADRPAADFGAECVRIEPISSEAGVDEVFQQICEHPDWPFVPIVDADGAPIGVVRERDLKGYAYARFGRDLVKRRTLDEFLRPTLVLPIETSLNDLLASSARNPNPDGIVFTEGGRYCTSLLTGTLLRLFERQHLDTQVRLVQAEKMEAIGSLAGGIAHDLNNILTPVLAYADFLSVSLREGEPVDVTIIDEILVCAKRAKEVVRQILAFSRHQENERTPVHLGAAIRETVKLVRASIPSTIDIELDFDVDDDVVLASHIEIQRVIMNLCTNAYHAMRDRGGHLQISLHRHDGPLAGWSLGVETAVRNGIRLSVADTGAGIAPDILPRIFEPFFTSDRGGERTGLGLSVVHGIVARYKGAISVETEPGRGTTFHVHLPLLAPGLPLAAAAGAGAGPEIAALAPSGGAIRVMFVDDEFAITRMASRNLPRYGIAVEAYNDSRAALTAFLQQGRRFHALVTDQTMPGVTGADLVREVLRAAPDLPVVVCTGYSDTFTPEQAKSIGVQEYMLKPLDFRRMAHVIRSLVCRSSWPRGAQPAKLGA